METPKTLIPTTKLESWLYLADELIARYGYECKEAMKLRWEIAQEVEIRKLRASEQSAEA
jgi:hypothetical protein